jgi:transposase
MNATSQGKNNGSAECANTQLSLFDRSVIGHATADQDVLCPIARGESKRRIMGDAEQIPKKRPTYRQEWHEYNLAQVNEKAHFQELLYQLCSLIEEPVQTFGRPRMPLADIIFGAAYKVYSTVSGRRQQSDIRQAHARGYVSHAAHYNTIFKYLEMEMLTPYLHQLIRESSLPLKTVETDFAVDSSGFRVKGFVRWFNTKYGKEVENHDWLKVHLMCGVKTNIVTSVEITERHAHDSPRFKPLVTATAASGFTIEEVSGDKAYSSGNNLRLVEKHGGKPYIKFKDNARGDGKNKVWNRIFHTFALNREEYLTHYHKRSNVESTFWMIKSKFGEQIRSKVRTAQTNEALLKVLCHNICVVIQSMYELGIEADFMGKTSTCP